LAVAREPQIVDQLVSPAQALLAIGLFVAVIARLADRVHGATRLGRRTLTPVLAVAMGWALVVGVTLGVRLAWPGAVLVEVGVWLIAFTVPAMAAAFLIGLMRWWLYVGASLRRLAARLRSPLAPQELRSAMAYAFEDPALEVVYRRANGWVDDEDQPLALPALGAGRCLTEVRNGDRIVGGLIHDAALRYERAFSDAAASCAALTLQRHRLAADTDLLLRELPDSRARIAAIADVAALARGTYPYVLTDQGLAAALALAAGDARVSTTVVAEARRRYAADIEHAVYFCCLEAMQNAAKHAGDAAAVRITVAEHGDSVCFGVHDNGVGFELDTMPAGVGLTNIRDRVAAVGGRVTIDSTPGLGTRIGAAIPLTRTHATDREA
jgi:two-component sensor histidine kinase